MTDNIRGLPIVVPTTPRIPLTSNEMDTLSIVVP